MYLFQVLPVFYKIFPTYVCEPFKKCHKNQSCICDTSVLTFRRSPPTSHNHWIITQQSLDMPITTQPTRDVKNAQAALRTGSKIHWSTGTFDCMGDCGGCVCGCLCPCFYMGTQAKKLDENYCAGFCCPAIANLALRAKLREKHFLDGGLGGDLCCALLCGSCMTCQTGRELSNLGY